ncbi:MAG: Ig domain-containing protein [Lachnospiraceae bacterium]
MKYIRKNHARHCLTICLIMTLIVVQCISPVTVFAAAAKTSAVRSIQLDKKVLNLQKGKTATVKAKIFPSAVKNVKLQWKSSKPQVATVNQKGKIVAKNKGSAKITATVRGTKKSASCTVNVSIPVSKLTVTPSKTKLFVKDKIQLKTKILPSNASFKKLIYKSQNPKIATVDQKGVVTGKAKGTTNIIVQVKDTKKKQSVSITVQEKKADKTEPGISDQTPGQADPSTSESNPSSNIQPSIAEPEPDPIVVLSIQALEDAPGVIQHWSTSAYVENRQEGFIELKLTITGTSMTGLTDAFCVIPTQEDATVTIEDDPQEEFCKKITLSKENVETNIYHVVYERENLFGIKTVSCAGQPCTIENQKIATAGGEGYLKLNIPYEGQIDWNVETKYSDVQWTMEDSDREGFSKKIVLTHENQSASYYVKFEEAKEELYILELYLNGKMLDLSQWHTKDTIKEHKMITTLSSDFSIHSDDELRVVPATADTQVQIEESDISGYLNKIVLTNGEKTKTYYLKGEEEKPLEIQSVMVDGIGYREGREKNYFEVHTYEGYQTLELYGSEQPQWKTFTVTPKDPSVSVAQEDLNRGRFRKTLMLSEGERLEYFAVRWNLQPDLWGLASVSVDGQTYYLAQNDEHLNHTYEWVSSDQAGQDELNTSSRKTLVLYCDTLNASKELKIHSSNLKTKVEVRKDKLILTYGSYQEQYDIQYKLADSIWKMKSIQAGGQTYESQSVDDIRLLPQQYFKQNNAEESTIEVYGTQKELGGDIQVEMENPNVNVTVSVDSMQPNRANFCMEYQGETQEYQLTYQLSDQPFLIQEIDYGKYRYAAGYESGQSYFVQGRDTILMTGIAQCMGDDLTFIMKDPEVKVELFDSVRDGYEKRVIFTKGDLQKSYDIRYTLNEKVWKVSSVKCGATEYKYAEYQYNSYGEPTFLLHRNESTTDVSELILYGTKKGFDTDFIITPLRATLNVEILEPDRSGYLKKVRFSYGNYERIYYVKYDVLPEVWSLAWIQTKQETYGMQGGENEFYFTQYEDEVTIYGTEKSKPSIQKIVPMNRDVVCKVEDAKSKDEVKTLVLTYGSLKKELPLYYQPLDSVWQLKNVQAGSQTYQKEMWARTVEHGYSIEHKILENGSYMVISLFGTEEKPEGAFTIEAENPQTKVKVEETDRPDTLGKVTLTYGEFTKIYYIQYSISDRAFDLLQIQNGADVYEPYDESAPESKTSYFRDVPCAIWDPDVTDCEILLKPIMIYGGKEELGSDLSVVCRVKDADITIEDCDIPMGDSGWEYYVLYKKKVTVNCYGKKMIYYIGIPEANQNG